MSTVLPLDEQRAPGLHGSIIRVLSLLYSDAYLMSRRILDVGHGSNICDYPNERDHNVRKDGKDGNYSESGIGPSGLKNCLIQLFEDSAQYSLVKGERIIWLPEPTSLRACPPLRLEHNHSNGSRDI